jgi:hypothetical protein
MKTSAMPAKIIRCRCGNPLLNTTAIFCGPCRRSLPPRRGASGGRGDGGRFTKGRMTMTPQSKLSPFDFSKVQADAPGMVA